MLSDPFKTIPEMRLIQIYNFAPHYREGVFKLIDSTFNCDYVFGTPDNDIKQMDLSLLNGTVEIVKNRRFLKSLYFQPHVLSKAFKYDTFLVLGDTRCLSTWILSIVIRLFYPQKRLYFWSHGWYGKENKVERVLKRLFFSIPNGGVFLYGNYARRLMIKEGFNPQKLYTIHNSLSYDEQVSVRNTLLKESIFKEHFGNECPVLVFVGRLTPVKKLDMILDAVSLCEKNGWIFNLVLIGSGEKEKELIEYATQLEISQRIWFYGACYNEKELGRLIYNADICVSPGNVGLTAMHSMVYGTPVITHNNFALQMPEFEAIIPGITGDFFEFDNVQSLSSVIIKWNEQKGRQRESVREACFNEIDTDWTPRFQINVLKKAFEND